MKQAEILDQLIEGHYYQGSWRLVSDEEIAQSLAAAEKLTRLQEIDVPADLAVRLERSLRDRVCMHSHLQQSGTLASNRGILLIAGRRRPTNARHASRRQGWIVLLGTAAALVFSFMSLLAFSSQSLPGDPLYGLKEAKNQFSLTFVHDPQIRAHSAIVLLQGALDDLRTVVADRRGDEALMLAMKTVADRTNECRSTAAALSDSTQRAAAQQNLSNVLTQEEQTVRQLLTQLDWPMRVLFTQQLGVLGDPVPTVTHVTVHVQSNGTSLVTLTGTHFALQAELIIDGLPKEGQSQVTANQLVVTLSSSELPPRAYAFGVLNPDGAAAQMVFKRDRDGDDTNESGNTPNQYGTPVTPNPDGDNDD